MIKELETLGITVLENQSGIYDIKGKRLQVIGVSDYFSGKTDINKAYSNVENGFSIVMTHDPVVFDDLKNRGPSLVLAGHTHGGQIRLPFFPTIYAPGQGFFPRYGNGLYKENDSYLFISTGLGHTGILPFRFWNRPELVIIALE